MKFSYEYIAVTSSYKVTIDDNDPFYVYRLYIDGESIKTVGASGMEIVSYKHENKELHVYTTEYANLADGKPPLGVCPYKVVAFQRIQDLSRAITRQLCATDKPNIELIEQWAKEITLQTDVIRFME